MATVSIVGAGVGGLTAALKLAHAGHSVDVFEKLAEPGGRCGRVTLGDFQFDLGPTILLMPFVLEETFASVGLKLSDYLTLHRCDPNYVVHYRDGSRLTLTSDLTRMRTELEALEPGSFEKYLRFMAVARDQHDTSLTTFVGQHFDSLAQFLAPGNLLKALRIGAHKKVASHVAGFFKDPRIQQAMSFQTMYLGVSSFEAPAVFALLPYTELAVGVWFPMGGLSAVPRALEKAAREKGVRFHYQAPVERIVIENARATGVAFAGGRVHRSDLVLCNADLPWAYKHLIDPQVAPREDLERKRYTSSGYMLYLGMKKRIDALGHHNMFFGKDFAGAFTDIFEKQQVPDDLFFYVNAPAHTDPSMAPAGKDALYVLVPVPHQTPNVDWKTMGPIVRAKVFARLKEEGYGDLEADLECERVITPDDWASSLNLVKGSAFGLAQNIFQVGPFRPRVYDERVQNLFFCGASAQPGTGVPTVMVSARLACEAIAKRAVLPLALPNPGARAATKDVAA